MDRLFSKSDFHSLQVIGQFNKGFILALSSSNDLFILDQHACDEKYNFETLSLTTVLQSQVLVHPIKLDLGVTQLLALQMHKQLF